MRSSTHCKRFVLLAMLVPTLFGCRSPRELWPLAQLNPSSLREPHTSPSPETNGLATSRLSAPNPQTWLPSLDAVDSSAKPLDPASPPQYTPQVTDEQVTDEQLASTQLASRPTPNSLVDAFESESQPFTAEQLLSYASVPLTPAAHSQALPASGMQVAPSSEPPVRSPARQLPSSASDQPATTAVAAPTPATVSAVRLVITNVRPGHGDVKVAIFTDGSAFPEPSGAVQTFSLPGSQPTLEQGLDLNSAFAVAVYQDVNGDGELSRSRMGIPVEPFAFSNNVMGQRGPPSFQQASVVVPSLASVPLIVTINLP